MHVLTSLWIYRSQFSQDIKLTGTFCRCAELMLHAHGGILVSLWIPMSRHRYVQLLVWYFWAIWVRSMGTSPSPYLAPLEKAHTCTRKLQCQICRRMFNNPKLEPAQKRTSSSPSSSEGRTQIREPALQVSVSSLCAFCARRRFQHHRWDKPWRCSSTEDLMNVLKT